MYFTYFALKVNVRVRDLTPHIQLLKYHKACAE